MEASAQVIVNPTGRHPVQGQSRGLQTAQISVAPVDAQEQLHPHRVRELRRAAESSVRTVERAEQRVGRGRHEARGKEPVPFRNRAVRRQSFSHLLRARLDFVPPGSVDLGQPEQQRAEAGPAVAVLGGKVGAAEERLERRRQKDAHRPAALTAHQLHRRHVDLIEVGALLAVDFDADEVLVQVARDPWILEGLSLHHMAPVAGRIADREEDRLVLPPRPSERLVSPRVPVDRVFRMLAEVGARLVRQAIAPAPAGAQGGICHSRLPCRSRRDRPA